MLDFILKYWIQVIFGVIVAAIGLFGRKFWSMYKEKSKSQLREEIRDEISNSINKLSEENQEQNKQIQSIYAGIINLQGISFKSYCRNLLRDDYELTLKDFENCQQEYEAYVALGGNGQGKILFDLVCEKAKSLSNTKKSGTSN